MRGGRHGRMVLIDAHSLIYRAFFALPPMSTSSGEVTNAAYGFTSMLAIVLASRPEFASAAFDVGGPTFRSEEYAAYKEGRRPMPDDLRPQIERCRQILEAFGIPIYGVPGFEADDVIGSLARKATADGLKVTIVSGDLDCLQLVGDRVEALVPRRGITDTMLYGADQVRQRYGLEPPQLIDYKTLRGDTSDNIPGVPGVGDKTATQLVQRFGNVEALLERLDELPDGRVKDGLRERVEQVRQAKRLVTIATDLDLDLNLDSARWSRYNAERVRELFDDLEFRQLLARFPPPDVVPVQPTLAFEPAPEARTAEVIDLARLCELAEGSAEIAVYPLWSGSARTARLLGLGLSDGSGAYYLPLAHGEGLDFTPGLLLSDAADVLARARASTHDVKESDLALRANGVEPPDWTFSTYLASYLLGAGSRDPRLEDLAREFLGRNLASPEQLLGTGRSARSLTDISTHEAAEFAAPRAQAILQLQPRLDAEVKNLGVDYLYRDVEMPLGGVLAEMEWEGVAIDVPYLREMEVELSQQLASLENRVTEMAGHAVNIGAPQQLARLLFEELSLPTGKRIKTGYSTDADTLESLRDRHPVVPLILEHRQLSKLKSTYVDALPGLVDPFTGRLHTSLNQAATATGRLSSSNPNLMNIPIRTELGQRIRRAFRAARPGHQLFGADYSQIELRIAAHLSQDPQMLAAFEAGHDIHAATASRVFKVPLEAVDANQRRLAKVANFGSLYGQGEYGLSNQMGIPGEEAREFLAQYWGTYARLREYLDSVRNRAREDGFVVSLTGRRRAIPDLRSPNYQLRQAAERMAINFPIQSLAADIIKIAMVRLQKQISESQLRGRMILQVHDELLFEVPDEEVATFEEMVTSIMVGAYELTCGLEVETKAGPNWADMRKLITVQA